MRIVVEGPDGAGKTILIEHLMADFQSLRVVRNHMQYRQNFNLWWPTTLAHPRDTPIHDRFFYSELVYGPVIRGHISADLAVVKLTQETLRQEALLIYCRPPFDILVGGLIGRPQMDGVREHIDAIVEEYDHLMMRESVHYGRRFHVYDRTNYEKEPAGVTKLVREYLSGDLR